MNWRDFWNGDNPIYVSYRHQRLHYRGIADDLIRLVEELCPLPEAASVLDFGCGRALDAGRVADRCAHLTLAESASRVVEELRQRHEGDARISVCDADTIGQVRAAGFDLIVVNSVIQYLDLEELKGLLARLRRVLAADGHLVIADVIPRGDSTVADVRALLRFAARGGFLTAALVGLVRTVFSDYRQLRSTLGISQYSEREMLALLTQAGFDGTRHARNMGHIDTRMTFVARPTPRRSLAERRAGEGPEAMREEAPHHDDAGGQHLRQ